MDGPEWFCEAVSRAEHRDGVDRTAYVHEVLRDYGLLTLPYIQHLVEQCLIRDGIDLDSGNDYWCKGALGDLERKGLIEYHRGRIWGWALKGDPRVTAILAAAPPLKYVSASGL